MHGEYTRRGKEEKKKRRVSRRYGIKENRQQLIWSVTVKRATCLLEKLTSLHNISF
jgi:hypothetical protein